MDDAERSKKAQAWRKARLIPALQETCKRLGLAHSARNFPQLRKTLANGEKTVDDWVATLTEEERVEADALDDAERSKKAQAWRKSDGADIGSMPALQQKCEELSLPHI